jgi:hypothetical protein
MNASDKLYAELKKLPPPEQEGKFREILQGLPLSVGMSPRLFLPQAICAIRYYGDARFAGCLEKLTEHFLPGSIFGSLWGERCLLNERQIEVISAEVKAIHGRALERWNVVWRSEFAFLTGWTGGFRWAGDWRNKYESAHHGIDELTELAELSDPDRAMKGFFGHGRNSDRMKWDEMAAQGQDSVRTQIGLSRRLYEQLIAPRAKEYHDELIDFVIR